MTAPNTVPASSAPRVNPLQRLWLRELGMERLWLRPAPQPVAAPAPQVVVSKTDSPAAEQAGGAMAPAPARDAIAASPPAAAQSPAQAPAARAASPAPGLRNGPPPKPAPKVEAEEAAPAVIPVAERVKNANLDELREQVLACTACGLCNGRRHAVFGHGGQPTRWLVVGEAPGEQ